MGTLIIGNIFSAAGHHTASANAAPAPPNLLTLFQNKVSREPRRERGSERHADGEPSGDPGTGRHHAGSRQVPRTIPRPTRAT